MPRVKNASRGSHSPVRRTHIPIDPNGNLTQKIEGSDTWTYEWTAENQLKRVLKNSVEQVRFAYDPLGRRVEKVAGSATTTYTYDGEDILREITSSSTLKYIHGPRIDEALAQEDGTGVLSSFHADGLGSVVTTTSSAGAVTATRRYDAFGNLEVGATNGYAFTGREWDSEAGLYYYRARYYDPKIGRFISEDPLEVTERPLPELNAYGYVANNPINRVDPLGLQSCPPDRNADCVGAYVQCRWRVLILMNVTARAACAAACAAAGPIGIWKCRFLARPRSAAVRRQCSQAVMRSIKHV